VGRTLFDYVKNPIIREYKLPLVMISIIGKMGSGKTNVGYHLLQELREVFPRYDYGKNGWRTSNIKSVYFQFDWDRVDDFWETIRGLKGKVAYVFIDDVSFALETRERKSRQFLNQLARIRHENPKIKHWFLAVAFHYSKATVPFVRQSQVVIVTSVTTEGEINGLKEFFKKRVVEEYYRYYLRYRREYPILVNSWGNIWIASGIPYYKYKKWGIVV